MNSFHDAINSAAEITDHGLSDNDTAVTASKPGVERMKALRLLADARIQSATRQVMADIKGAHPEASSLLLSGRTNVGLKPPKGLADHLASIIGRVLTEPGAEVVTFSAWTAELNKVFGNRFNPGTFFSKKRLGKQLRARLDSTLAARGLASLPTGCVTLAQAVKVARAARLGQREDASRFAGGVGRIVGSRLLLGSNTFAIEQHAGHDCIRVPRGDGSRGRARLSDLEQILTGSGLGLQGSRGLPSSTCRVGEPAQSPEIVSIASPGGGAWAGSSEQSPISADALAFAETSMPKAPALAPDWATRISVRAAERRVHEQARAAELAAVLASGIDPLEI